MQPRPSTTPRTPKNLKCRQCRDYYGNSETGLCSKCLRDTSTKSIPTAEKTDHNVPAGGHSARPTQSKTIASPSLYKHVIESRSLLRKKDSLVSAMRKNPHANPPKCSDDSYVPDSIETKFMQEFCQIRISEDGKRELKRRIQKLDDEIQAYMNTTANKDIEKLRDMVQNTYAEVSHLMNTDKHFENTTNDDREHAINVFEKVIMIHNHKFLFSPYFTNDEANDDKVQKHIRQLSWITAKHLKCSIDEVNADCRELIYNAISELVSVDSYYSPQEKLECIMRCCQHILKLLNQSVRGPASADEFLPALIFVVLKANPVRLHSNINFVTRFTIASRSTTGECAYYFTTLRIAITFIEGVNAESLGISEKDFHELMSGDKLITTPWETALLACESLHLISQNIKVMSGLKKRNLNMTNSIGTLNSDMKSCQMDITRKLQSLREKAPLKVLPIKTPPNVTHLARLHLDGTLLYEHALDEIALNETNDSKTAAAGHYEANLTCAFDGLPSSAGLKITQLAAPLIPTAVATEGPQVSQQDPQSLNSLPSVPDSISPTFIIPPPLSGQSPIALPTLHPSDTPFDEASIEVTPTCSHSYETSTVAPLALANINYDFNLFDQVPETNADGGEFNLDLDEFDPLRQVKDGDAEPAQISELLQDDNAMKPEHILDGDTLPNSDLLPSPLKPEYCGFTNSNTHIQTITCNTGDFGSMDGTSCRDREQPAKRTN